MDVLAKLRNSGRRGLLVAVGMMAVALLLAACSGSDDDDRGPTGGLGLTSSEAGSLLRAAGFSGGVVDIGTGIRATGVGVVEAAPDIAVLSVGVETFASTVSVARDEAASAMDAMLNSLRAANVSDEDIATQFFNIQPEYTFEEVIITPEGGERIRRSERKLVGYRVTNTLSVTLRDLDEIGGIIDGVAAAGGNAVRVNGISFTVEDGTTLEEQARTLALRDAVAKADLYATETGVSRGKLVAISEISTPQFPKTERLQAGADLAVEAVPTQILAGDLEIRVTVMTVFEID